MSPKRWSRRGVTLACLLLSGVSWAATLTGSIDDGVNPVATARVTLFDDSLTTFLETRSDAAGGWSLIGAPTGNYRLGVAARGFEYVEIPITITADATFDTSLTEEMHPGEWSIIGSTAPEFLDATDIAALLPDGRLFFCHDTTDSILFDPVTGALNRSSSETSSAAFC